MMCTESMFGIEDLPVEAREMLLFEIDQMIADLEAHNPEASRASPEVDGCEQPAPKCEDHAVARGDKKLKTQKKKRSSQKKKKTSMKSLATSSVQEVSATNAMQAVDDTTVSLNLGINVVPVADFTRYCICNELSYGDMIACDNPSCPREWFHFPCVNVTAAPEGSWYCPDCRGRSKKRKMSSSVY